MAIEAKNYDPALNQGAQIGGDNLDASSVSQSELNFETADVTVTAASATGNATVTSGSIILGYHPAGNQDQFVDNIAVSGTTVTVTLAANATADNTFKIVLLKA